MKDLTYQLKGLCLSDREGAYSTRYTRLGVLALCADQLHELGFRVRHPKGLKPKHVESLVNRWLAEGLAAGTVKNRLAHLRWWGDKVGKASIFHPTNDDYGIEARQVGAESRAWVLDKARRDRVACPYVRYALRLQAMFGLRREEAIKFMPNVADKGDRLGLRPSWCKGGRGRVVPVRSDAQRALLDEVAAFVGKGALIPPNRNYVEQLTVYKAETARAGIINAHGLRHGYAQRLYEKLTGWAAPLAGGPAWRDLPPAGKAMDRKAREVISRELGHGRVEVTNAYLGGRAVA
jgi:integrase